MKKSEYYQRGLISLFSTFFILCSIACQGQQSLAPIALNGTLNLNDWDFQKDGTVKLEGNWEFYWNTLLSPSQPQMNLEKEYIGLPGIWNKQGLSSFGYATYKLKVLGHFTGKDYALYLPDTYCNYRLWLDDKVIAENGKVGTSEENSIPQWSPSTVNFIAKSDTITLYWQISNFEHSKGGVSRVLELGTVEAITSDYKRNLNANFLLVAGIGLLVIILLAFSIIYKKMYLFLFTLFCFFWSIRGMFSNMYLFIQWFPDFDFTTAVRIEYLTLYCSLLVGVITFLKLYPKHTHKIVEKISIVVNTVFILITLFAPVAIFTGLLTTFFIYLGLSLTYVFISIVNTAIHAEKGSTSLSIVVFLTILLFIYDLFSYQKFIDGNPYILSIGYLIIYYLLGGTLLINVVKKVRSPNPIKNNTV